MSKSESHKLHEIHEEALLEFDRIQDAVRDERMQCLEDRRFYSIAGAQWEGALGDQFENSPRLESNKILLSIIRIINEYRNNRITVDFVSNDGEENDPLAETCDDLYRSDEHDSCAQEAYDNAFEEAVGGGFGAWRLRTAYEDEADEENDKQRIRIEPLYDADSSVFFDLNAKLQDKSDAKSCYVLTPYELESYKEEFNDDPVSWAKEINHSEFDWHTGNVVYVAEYYRVEETSKTIHVWENVAGEEERYDAEAFEEDEGLMKRLLSIGSKELRQKKVKRKRVRKYLLSGGKVLEDCGYIAGSCIPVVPVYGKRWFIDNVERCMGHVRPSKDMQRLKNMLLSKLGEISASSPVEKPAFFPEQIAGHQQMWADDTVKKYPYLLVNPVKDANGNTVPFAGPGGGYTKPPQIPQATAALLQIVEQDMKDLLGNQEAAEELHPNVSGKALELVSNRLDMQSFIYMSNMSKSVKRSGEIWLSMARDTLVEPGRKLKGIGRQGEIKQIELARRVVDDSGRLVLENDIANAKFGVHVEVGPTSSSKRASTVRSLTGMIAMSDDPEVRQVLGAMAMMNMEGEGISEVRDYFRKKLIKLGVIKPTEEEIEELTKEAQNAVPDPNAEYLRAAAEEASANATQAQAKSILTIAQADETKAKTMKTITEVDAKEQEQAMEIIEKFGGMAQARQAVEVLPVDGNGAA